MTDPVQFEGAHPRRATDLRVDLVNWPSGTVVAHASRQLDGQAASNQQHNSRSAEEHAMGDKGGKKDKDKLKKQKAKKKSEKAKLLKEKRAKTATQG
jgi:hypothetical protein